MSTKTATACRTLSKHLSLPATAFLAVAVAHHVVRRR
jgi:hypothetical protein